MLVLKSNVEKAALYLEHVARNAWVKRDIAQKGIPLKNRKTANDSDILIASESMVRELGSRLVCPKCEHMAFGHWENGHKGKPMAKCPDCGWHGEGITFDEYITMKLYS